MRKKNYIVSEKIEIKKKGSFKGLFLRTETIENGANIDDYNLDLWTY